MKPHERLQLARKYLDKTQGFFAKKMGLARSAYQKLEYGTTPLTTRHLMLLEQSLHINSEWLKTGEGEILVLYGRDKEFHDTVIQLENDTRRFLMQIGTDFYKEQEQAKNKHR